MSTHKNIDIICVAAAMIALIIALVYFVVCSFFTHNSGISMEYEERIFSTDKVHTIDIVMEDWDGFIENAQNEEYSMCSLVIDGEAVSGAAIRGKGNTSLSNVSQMDSERYSFKIEFDHYDDSLSYHGLDKLCLNNIIQDNTYMKDYLCYQMMNSFDVAAPLCSFAYITVNGEDWGLYLAVEAVEESFMQRNYGNSGGELYKPDSMSFGAGRGNGRDFRMSEFEEMNGEMPEADAQNRPMAADGEMPEAVRPQPGGRDGNAMPGGMNMGAEDVRLQYIDDDEDSYPNIFDNAKTDITDADKKRLIASLKQLSEYENIEEVVDIDAVLRYFVVQNFVVNDDSYTGNMVHNYYLYEDDGVMSMIPWDYNLAFGGFQGGNAESAVNDDIDEVLSDRPMQAWIFSEETYSSRYFELYYEMLESVDIQKIIDDAYNLISPYVEKDPTAFCTFEEFEKGVETLKKFCELRIESVRLQLSGSSETADASEIVLSDMGSMGNMGGPGGGRGEAGERMSRMNMPDSINSEAGGAMPFERSTEGTAEEQSGAAMKAPEISAGNNSSES